MLLSTSNDTTLKIHSTAEISHKFNLNYSEAKKDILKLELIDSDHVISQNVNSK